MNERVTLHMQLSGVPITGAAVLAMDSVWRDLAPMVMAVAKNLTKNPTIIEEMVDAAMCKLWDLDMTRYDLTSARHDGYIRQSLKNQVCDVWRKHNPQEAVTVEEAVGPEMMRAIRLDQRAAS